MKYFILFPIVLLLACGPSIADKQYYDLANIAIDSIIARHHDIQDFLKQDSARFKQGYQELEIRQYAFIKAYSIEFENIHDQELKNKLSERYSQYIHIPANATYSYNMIFCPKDSLDSRDRK